MSKNVTHITPDLLKYLTDDPIWNIHEQSLDIKANHIYLMGEESYVVQGDDSEPGVEYTMANRFIKNLNILMRKSTKPILIHLKTCGGYWPEGMAIYDMIKACPNKICILNYTHARSMSSLIFQAADRRVMMPNSEFMYHHGSMGYEGTTRQFLTEAKQLERTINTMKDIYIDRMLEKGSMSDLSGEEISNFLEEQMKLKEDVYLNAKETVEFGLADYIFGADGLYDWSALVDFKEKKTRKKRIVKK